MSMFIVLFCSCLFAACAGAADLPVVRSRDTSLPKEGYRLSVLAAGMNVAPLVDVEAHDADPVEKSGLKAR